MNMIYRDSSTVSGLPLIYPILPTIYSNTGERRGEAYELKDSTTTASVSSVIEPERELSPYELISSNGALAFWDNPEEDIYSFEDGEAI